MNERTVAGMRSSILPSAEMAHDGQGRDGKTVALAAAVARIAKPIFGRRGFASGAIVREWAEIVGPSLARTALPEKIVYAGGENAEGTLHLRVAHGTAALEIQHLEPVLVERINAYFGYRAVARLRLVQGPLPAPKKAPAPVTRPLDRDEERELALRLAPVSDPRLRETLAALGRAILGRRKPSADDAAR